MSLVCGRTWSARKPAACNRTISSHSSSKHSMQLGRHIGAPRGFWAHGVQAESARPTRRAILPYLLPSGGLAPPLSGSPLTPELIQSSRQAKPQYNGCHDVYGGAAGEAGLARPAAVRNRWRAVVLHVTGALASACVAALLRPLPCGTAAISAARGFRSFCACSWLGMGRLVYRAGCAPRNAPGCHPLARPTAWFLARSVVAP